MRLLIDQFFEKIGITPRVVMEPFDTETIKSLVESGFGWSILPEHALRQRSRFFRTSRIEGHQTRVPKFFSDGVIPNGPVGRKIHTAAVLFSRRGRVVDTGVRSLASS